MTVDYDKIKRLVALLEQNRLTELAVEEEGLSVTIKAEMPSTVAAAPVEVAQSDVHIDLVLPEAPEQQPETAEPRADLFQIKSPMVGVFYRRPSPDSPAFVEVGDEVELGQTIGLIEAMKVYSEVPAEAAGRVVTLPVENGKLVQQGDVLAEIDTSAADGPLTGIE